MQRVTTALFENHGALAAAIPESYQISEQQQAGKLPYPVHRGAERYYRRSEPGFLVVYAEVIALVMSLGLTALAALSTIHRWSTHRKKQRIDYYYTQVARTVKRLRGVKPTIEFLENEEERLATLRSTAYEELVSEHLKADESFRNWVFDSLPIPPTYLFPHASHHHSRLPRRWSRHRPGRRPPQHPPHPRR